MFTTKEQVAEMTNYVVTDELVYQAQVIIEAFIGKLETEVVDPEDRLVMGRAVAFQAAYMKDNYSRTYEQMAIRSIVQTDGTIALDEQMASPFIAPMAIFSLRNLSWRRSKSIKTGSTFGTFTPVLSWEKA